MNIIEAIKSGNKFKRKHKSEYLSSSDYRCTSDFCNYVIDEKDLLAADWEIEQQKVSLTRAEALELYGIGLNIASMRDPKDYEHIINRKLLELGFKDE